MVGTGGISSLELGARPGIGGILGLVIGVFSSSGTGWLLSSGTGVFSQACSKLRLPSLTVSIIHWVSCNDSVRTLYDPSCLWVWRKLLPRSQNIRMQIRRLQVTLLSSLHYNLDANFGAVGSFSLLINLHGLFLCLQRFSCLFLSPYPLLLPFSSFDFSWPSNWLCCSQKTEKTPLLPKSLLASSLGLGDLSQRSLKRSSSVLFLSGNSLSQLFHCVPGYCVLPWLPCAFKGAWEELACR